MAQRRLAEFDVNVGVVALPFETEGGLVDPDSDLKYVLEAAEDPLVKSSRRHAALDHGVGAEVEVVAKLGLRLVWHVGHQPEPADGMDLEPEPLIDRTQRAAVVPTRVASR